MKVVINNQYGGFGVSREAFLKLREMGNKYALEEPDFGEYFNDGSGPRSLLLETFLTEIPRHDPDLISIIELMGEESWGPQAKLKIVEIPDGVEYEVEEYDGNEWISEKHRKWS